MKKETKKLKKIAVKKSDEEANREKLEIMEVLLDQIQSNAIYQNIPQSDSDQ